MKNTYQRCVISKGVKVSARAEAEKKQAAIPFWTAAVDDDGNLCGTNFMGLKMMEQREKLLADINNMEEGRYRLAEEEWEFQNMETRIKERKKQLKKQKRA